MDVSYSDFLILGTRLAGYDMADLSPTSLDSTREELLAAGILGVLAPAVEQVDQKIGEVR